MMNQTELAGFLSRAALYPCEEEKLRNQIFAADGYTEAAVLLPVVFHERQWQIILTRRSANLRRHTGQISFAGGKKEPHDVTPAQTALREAEEEIGTHPAVWQTFPALPPHYSPSGYEVRPVPALNAGSPNLTANPDEVAEIIYLPLETALNPQNYRPRTLQYRGQTIRPPALSYLHHDIWGLTAMILYGLAERYRHHMTQR